ncbi:MAG: class F sortase [Acidobacteria bacterium]|nr:class F sortase [Acidobacteriota bacterium]
MNIRMVQGALVLLLLLPVSACASPTAVEDSPTPTPTSVTPPPNSGSVGTQSAALQPVRAAVPPVRVQVPAGGIDVTVEPVGVLADGQMELPANPRVAGWYRYGPDPESDAGGTVIAAHVDSLKYGLGPFSKLKLLSAGTKVQVTTADGVSHSYKIQTTQKILKTQLPIAQLFDRTGAPRLILITCGGQFDNTTLHYSDNIFVTAVPDAP